MTSSLSAFTDAHFKTSTYTDGNGTCVEVATTGDAVAIRDTKFRQAAFAVPAGAFAAMIDTIKAGGLELPA